MTVKEVENNKGFYNPIPKIYIYLHSNDKKLMKHSENIDFGKLK